MKINVDGLTVYFPYDLIYPEQYAYMLELKKSLDAKGHCMLEMPSGTGKTISLLALIIAYLDAHPNDYSKLVYCSRTVPEIEKTVEELRNLLQYTERETGKRSNMMCVALSSRKNMCIHPKVSTEHDGKVVDSRCLSLTASFVRARHLSDPENVPVCDFFEMFDKKGKEKCLPPGVYNLDDLREYGRAKGWCPYYVARNALKDAKVLVYSYYYVLDPKIADIVARELPGDSIVVFDEAHNIDTVCIDSMSVTLKRRTLDRCAQNLRELQRVITEVKQTDASKLQREYDALLAGLRTSRRGAGAASTSAAATDELVGSAVLPDDLVAEAVPGSIRNAEHFIAFLRRFLEYLRMRMRQTRMSGASVESSAQFVRDCHAKMYLDRRSLRLASDRFRSLLKALEIVSLSDYAAVTSMTQFASLVSTYAKGFAVVSEPVDENLGDAAQLAAGHSVVSNTQLHLACLDASLAIRPVFARFRAVVITSGTLSPLEMYPRVLNFAPVNMCSLSITLARPSICPMVVARGNDQVVMSSKFDTRDDPAVVRNYGTLLLEMAMCVPDGIACFFPSYAYLDTVMAAWYQQGLVDRLQKYKLLFVETTDIMETSAALMHYQRACDSGRGAILLSVARGKVCEGVDFDHHYGRCVIVFGVPFVYTQSRSLKARLDYLRENFQIREGDFLTFDALRQAAQCVGRALRGKTDYGLMLFADKRFARLDKKSKLPRWILEHLSESHCNLSIAESVNTAKRFLRLMAQPLAQSEQLGISLLTKEQLESADIRKLLEARVSRVNEQQANLLSYTTTSSILKQ